MNKGYVVCRCSKYSRLNKKSNISVSVISRSSRPLMTKQTCNFCTMHVERWWGWTWRYHVDTSALTTWALHLFCLLQLLLKSSAHSPESGLFLLVVKQKSFKPAFFIGYVIALWLLVQFQTRGRPRSNTRKLRNFSTEVMKLSGHNFMSSRFCSKILKERADGMLSGDHLVKRRSFSYSSNAIWQGRHLSIDFESVINICSWPSCEDYLL